MISIVTVTGRKDPGFAYMADCFYNQWQEVKTSYPEVKLEWIVVDKLAWEIADARFDEIDHAVKDRFNFCYTAPLETLWQGPNRLTSKDYWAKANASNTGLIYANHDFIYFIDDCSLLTDKYLLTSYQALNENPRRSIAGAYHYIERGGVEIENGKLIKGKIAPGDHRLEMITEPSPVVGQWLYGGSAIVPLWACIAANGFDSLMDGSAGLEDIEFGIRVSRLAPAWFYPNIGIYQIQDTHEPAVNFAASPSKTFKWIDTNGVIHDMTLNHLPVFWLGGCGIRWNEEKKANDIVPLDELDKHKTRVTTLGNPYKITDLRKAIRRGGKIDIKWPKKDWRDQQLLSEM